MPKKKEIEEKNVSEKKSPMPKPPARPILHKIKDFLAVIFYVLWIVIGIFFLLIIYGQVRGGALSSFIGSPPTTTSSQMQTPTETELPGIGTVNIDCVKGALKPESLQKLASSGDASFLQGDEKTNFEACIVSKESPSPSASPSK